MMHITISLQVLIHKALNNILFHLLWLSFLNAKMVLLKKKKSLPQESALHCVSVFLLKLFCE